MNNRVKHLACLVVLVIAIVQQAACADKPKLHVQLSSAAPGHLFIEGQPITFNALVAGQNKDTNNNWHDVSASYVVREVDGSWSLHKDLGTFSPSEARKITFSLPVNNRGLYEITLKAKAGNRTGEQRTRLGVTFKPHIPTDQSPWGLFLIPYDGPTDPIKAAALAESMRRLGVSWVRLNFWATAYEQVNVDEANHRVDITYSKWQSMADALNERGIRIMGTLCHVPSELSSQPGVSGPKNSDAGPLYARVMPRDMRLWQAFCEDIARKFPYINHWETWNEPNLPGRYWAGTRDEFATLVKHTAKGIKQGNPKARIVFSGFALGDAQREHPVPFADFVLANGVAPLVDIYSSHGLYSRKSLAPAWRKLMGKHGLPEDTPLWDTEPKAILPLSSWSHGVSKLFHFLHISPGRNYGAFAPLVHKDLTPTRDGLTYAAASHLIGSRPLRSFHDHQTAQVAVFADNARTTIAFKPTARGIEGGQVTVNVPESSRDSVELVDQLGRSTPLKVSNSQVTAPLSRIGFITTSGSLKVANVVPPRIKPEPVQHVFQFETATPVGPWNINRPTPGWTNDHVAGIWTKDQPAPGKPYSLILPINAPTADRYDLWLSADIWTRLVSPRTISTWRWKLNDGPWHTFDHQPKKMIWRKHGDRHEANTPVRDDEVFFLGGGSVLQHLTSIALTRGKHTFTVELTAPRERPDNAWCIYFDALILRPNGNTP